MNDTSFRVLQDRFVALYHEKAYQEVLDLIAQLGTGPAIAGPVDWLPYWSLCMYALLGKQEEALAVFRGALDAGLWFSPTQMASDPDLASLRPLPAFQTLVDLCQQRLAEAKAQAVPELTVELPAVQDGPLPLLMALHGNGSNVESEREHWQKVTGRGWLLAMPQSSQVGGLNAYVWTERERSDDEVRAHLTTLTDSYVIDPERIVLGGFSMGGGQIIWETLRQSVRARGFVALAPYLFNAELDTFDALLASSKPAGLRGYILVGEEDHPCLKVAQKVAALMHTHELACELIIRPGLTHDYPPAFAEVLEQALHFITEVGTVPDNC
jgi:predicted esterase